MPEVDQGWLRSAVSHASDPDFALVDSGSTNALRQAQEGELGGSRVIRVDLASGVTELHVNRFGTLLSQLPCQVIIPADYLVQLGYTIAWKKKGCTIQRDAKEKGFLGLDEYESRMSLGDMPRLKPITPSTLLPQGRARSWLAMQVAKGTLSREDQLIWLRAMFPAVPEKGR